jgi:hypothetical protein
VQFGFVPRNNGRRARNHIDARLDVRSLSSHPIELLIGGSADKIIPRHLHKYAAARARALIRVLAAQRLISAVEMLAASLADKSTPVASPAHPLK